LTFQVTIFMGLSIVVACLSCGVPLRQQAPNSDPRAVAHQVTP